MVNRRCYFMNYEWRFVAIPNLEYTDKGGPYLYAAVAAATATANHDIVLMS